MPELPEVETIKNTLQQFVVNKQIHKVAVLWPNIIKRPDDIEQFKTMLKGQTFRDLGRKGKFILFYLDDYVLVSHLRMEGKYGVTPSANPVNKHTHVIFSFTDGDELRYTDVRKFGTMHLFQKGEEFNHPPLNKLGPDPFEDHFTFDYFYKKIKRTDRFIKIVLLDQTIVSGLGNIYVDEILFKAGVHPLSRASRLTKKEIRSIYEDCIEIIDAAVKLGGTTIRSYVNSQGEMGMFQQELFAYGQEGEPCQNCGQPILKMKVGGRGTHVCTACQRKR
jgi:formamidopyrimidine-DNA glycosylase